MSHEQQQNLNSTSDRKPATEPATTSASTPQSNSAKQVQPTQTATADKATYAEKTSRIRAWTELIRSLAPFLWVAVILIVIVPLLGRGFIASSVSGNSRDLSDRSSDVVVIDKTLVDRSNIDLAIATALQDAHTKAENFASARLDQWVDQLMTRVDDSFLDWYFDYFNQKKMEFSAPFVWLSSATARWIDTQNPPPSQVVAEKLTEDFQTEFAKRVLRPKVAQLELERITRDTINLYISELGNNISSVQSTYKIPQGDWERYLGDIAITIGDTEGNISNLSLKLLVGGSSYLLAKAMIPAVTKIGSKVATSLAGKATAKIAAKTGGMVASNLGVQLLDPIVAVGILIWDVWDYKHTVKIDRPVLREAILDYLTQVKASLLDNPENGVMAAIEQLEGGILKSARSLTHSASEPVL